MSKIENAPIESTPAGALMHCLENGLIKGSEQELTLTNLFGRYKKSELKPNVQTRLEHFVLKHGNERMRRKFGRIVRAVHGRGLIDPSP